MIFFFVLVNFCLQSYENQVTWAAKILKFSWGSRQMSQLLSSFSAGTDRSQNSQSFKKVLHEHYTTRHYWYISMAMTLTLNVKINNTMFTGKS